MSTSMAKVPPSSPVPIQGDGGIAPYHGGTNPLNTRREPYHNGPTVGGHVDGIEGPGSGTRLVGNGGRRLTLGSIPAGIELIEDPDDEGDDRTDGSDLSGLTGLTEGASNTNIGSVGVRRGSVFRPAESARRRSTLRRIPDGIALVQMLEDLGDVDDDESMGDLGETQLGPLEPGLGDSTSDLNKTVRRTNTAITAKTEEEESDMPEYWPVLSPSSMKTLASTSSTRGYLSPVSPLPVRRKLGKPLFDTVMRAHLRALDLAGWSKWKKKSTVSDSQPLGNIITSLDALDIAAAPKMKQEGPGGVVDQSWYPCSGITERLPSSLRTGIDDANEEFSFGTPSARPDRQEKKLNRVLGHPEHKKKGKMTEDRVTWTQSISDASNFSCDSSTNSSASAVASSNVTNASSTCSAVTPLSAITSATKLEIRTLKNRRNSQSRHEEGVSLYGLMYYLNCIFPSASKDGSFNNVATPRFTWKVEKIKEASSTDGRIFASLLTALKGVLLSESGQDSLIPIREEIAVELKDKNARKALADQRISNLDDSTVLHLAAAGVAPCCLDLCKVLVEDFGADLDNIKDGLGRTARSIAIVNKNRRMIEWARAAGTLLGRYKIVKGPPVYKSATSEVRFARDITKASDHDVAIKMFASALQFERELKARLQEKCDSGQDIKSGGNRFSTDHVVKLHRFHEGSISCLVMPRGERSLDHIIRSEQIAGCELHLIRRYATCIARALHSVHLQGTIHGDLNPRNIVRVGSNLQLIDFDAAVKIGDPVCTENYSPVYIPPELARLIYFPDENTGNLHHQLEEMETDLAGITSSTLLAYCRAEMDSVRARIELLSGGKNSTPIAHPAYDIWSFGAVLFYLLTGSTLFQSDSEDRLVAKQDKEELCRWNGLRRHHLERVLAHSPGATTKDIKFAKDLLTQCLMPNPGDRPQSMIDVLHMPFFHTSVSLDSEWTPSERNRFRVLFAEPLVYVEKGEMKAIEKLNFERERSLLVECIRKVGRLVDVSFEPATDRHLLDAVAARCGVLHISCHGVKVMNQCGNSDGCVLLFEDGSGGAHFLSVEQIQKMFEAHSEPVKFAFVSACHSEQIGRALAGAGVPHVVCCEQSSELMDGAAAEFMRSFYSMLIEGHTVQTSFSSAVPLVSGRMGSEEASKFLLLPESSRHEEPIFDALEVESNEEQNIIAEHHLPNQPANIDGSEIALYSIVSELLKEERGKQLINIVGENNELRSNIVAAACHYIKDRLSTAIHIKKMLYIKCDAYTTAVGLRNSLQLSLSSHITAGKPARQQSKDFGEANVLNALAEMKALVVLDEFDGFEKDLENFLGALFRSAKKVHVLLATRKEVSCASAASYRKTVFV